MKFYLPSPARVSARAQPCCFSSVVPWRACAVVSACSRGSHIDVLRNCNKRRCAHAILKRSKESMMPAHYAVSGCETSEIYMWSWILS